ncbi:hypothetical protein BDV32DRAFT_76683 [Aspergillus pseudonomiae]|nr:hypothetical protein BDV32DRAFT_76683 [Aspergillus pseudonomiae]
MDSLTEALRSTRLSDDPQELEQLLFTPLENSGLEANAFNNIPRYLFRVVSPCSDGETNEKWVRSEAAKQNISSSVEDIFFSLNREKRITIARTLNLHLRWWPKDGLEDNFVSWTSSLLFAIQYIYYRHQSKRDGSSLKEIRLYVIDTTKFPCGTFIRDLDLIEAFWQFDNHPSGKDLGALRSLRNDFKHYFGEYLSQGSLNIANKHQMIPATSLFAENLLQRLQPQFAGIIGTKSGKQNPDWVKEVLHLRRSIWTGNKLDRLSSAEMLGRLEALKELADLFQPGWRFPLAIYFASLISSESVTEDNETGNDNIFFAWFRLNLLYEERISKPSNCKVIAPDTMPELQRVKEIVREIQKDSQLRQALDLVERAEASIRHLHIQNVFSTHGSAFLVVDRNEVLARAGQTVLSRLETIHMLSEEIIQAISPEQA